MKTIRITALLLALTLFAACGEKTVPSSQGTAPESALPSSDITSEIEPPEESNEPESIPEPDPVPKNIIPDDFVVGMPAPVEWEYMMPADIPIWSYTPVSAEAVFPCFTVRKDGKWGLIDEDGFLLLPCMADQPVVQCTMGHWIFSVDGLDTYTAEWEELTTRLKELGFASLCDGHGGSDSYHFVNTDSENTIPVDFIIVEGCIDFRDIPADELAAMDYEPAYFSGLETTDLGEEPAAGGYWNFVNGKGDILFPEYQFDLVGSFGDEQLAPVRIDGKWAYADKNGRVVTDFIYDSCWYMNGEGEPIFAYCMKNGSAPVLRDGRWGVIDSNGKEIVPCDYDSAVQRSGGTWLKKDGRWEKHFITLTSDNVQPMDWDIMMPADVLRNTGYVQMFPDDHSFHTVQKDGKWGLVDENGELLLPCLAERPVTRCFKGHWIYLAPGDLYDYEKANALLHERGHAPICGGHGDLQQYYFIETGSSDPPALWFSSDGSGTLAELTPDELAAMDYEPVYFAEMIPNEMSGTAPAENGYWNFVNGKGDILFPEYQFDLVGSFGDEQLAPVCIDGKWAYADRRGAIVTDFIYDSCWHARYEFDPDIGDFREIFPVFAYCMDGGYAPVLRDGKWGAIDSAGNEVMPCDYDGASPASDGIWLRYLGKWEKIWQKTDSP
ncbi:MAG: WG repeat-containing protein [Oscillospiraceae bacterium]|nr:WG repeat-containing protein [Oscillospiraceae bacterium]